MKYRADPTFLEFFAGGGMARLGLGPPWRCLMANDNCPKKNAVYADNFDARDLIPGDVWTLDTDAVATRCQGRPADLAWASFPCQDVSIAGARSGLRGPKSSAFFGFWKVIRALRAKALAPRAMVLENVPGLITAHGGEDFRALIGLLDAAGYRVGAAEIDAAHFVPQSRNRLFIIALRPDIAPRPPHSDGFGRTPRLVKLMSALGAGLSLTPMDVALPAPPPRALDLADVLEPDDGVSWASPEDAVKIFALAAPRHAAMLAKAKSSPEIQYGAAFRRVRVEAGVKHQRAEYRFDGLAGCLRTPRGGSSRQFIVAAGRGEVRIRPMTPEETARLMGLPSDYRLPARTSDALSLTGDGVAAPAVRWLSEHVLTPALAPALSTVRR